MKLLVATRNRGKVVELQRLLADLPEVELVGLDGFEDVPDVVEDADGFEGNAVKKACEMAKATGLPTLADDSGLVVDALDGAPGIHSARYAGEHGDDAANNALVLEKLADTPPDKRSAHYVALLVLADPTGGVRAETRGECHGRIVTTPRGTNGFGYDPLFEVREYHRTFGEMGPAVKRAISHRSRATRAMLPKLVKLLGS